MASAEGSTTTGTVTARARSAERMTAPARRRNPATSSQPLTPKPVKARKLTRLTWPPSTAGGAVVVVEAVVALVTAGAVEVVVFATVVDVGGVVVVVGVDCAEHGVTDGAVNAGGVRNDGWSKSKNSSMGSAAASRAVSAGRPKRFSMKRRIDVWSCTTCETKWALAKGDTTSAGTRTPRWSKAATVSVAVSIGGMLSGGTAGGGATWS